MKLEVNNRRKSEKFRNIKIKQYSQSMDQRRNHQELESFFEMDKNEKKTYQNLSDRVKTVVRRKLIAINVHIKK